MEISQITGAGKDPVANVKEDPQLKSIGAIPAVQPVKKDADPQQSTPEQQQTPSFEHLRQEPLHLLLRAVTARLQEAFGAAPAPHPVTPALEQPLTPELTCARILILLGTAFERYQATFPNLDSATAKTTFLKTAGDALHQGYDETCQLLRNLAMLEGGVLHDIDTTISLIQQALSTFPNTAPSHSP